MSESVVTMSILLLLVHVLEMLAFESMGNIFPEVLSSGIYLSGKC